MDFIQLHSVMVCTNGITESKHIQQCNILDSNQRTVLILVRHIHMLLLYASLVKLQYSLRSPVRKPIQL